MRSRLIIIQRGSPQPLTPHRSKQSTNPERENCKCLQVLKTVLMKETLVSLWILRIIFLIAKWWQIIIMMILTNQVSKVSPTESSIPPTGSDSVLTIKITPRLYHTNIWWISRKSVILSWVGSKTSKERHFSRKTDLKKVLIEFRNRIKWCNKTRKLQRIWYPTSCLINRLTWRRW